MRTIWPLLLVACSQTTSVNLTFGEDPTAGVLGTPVAFRCRSSLGRVLLPTRAVTGTGAERKLKVAIVVDFFATDGVPTCRASDISKWCQDHACHVIDDDAGAPRVCYDREQALGLTGDAVSAMAQILAGLEGELLTADAPHQPVIVRAVATAQSCTELGNGSSYATDKLVGCAYTCPVQLDSVSGDVLLDLPTVTLDCEPAVDFCATTGNFVID